MIEWYVAHTHAYSEAKARLHLLRQGYDVYLPLCRRSRSHARRREIVQRPLFPTYLFVGFDIEQTPWRPIFSTVGVIGLICNGDQPARVPDGVVNSIRGAEQGGVFDHINAVASLRPGALVRVGTGPFAGLIGKLQSSVSRDRVRVLLDLLGRQARAEFDISDIDAV